ncbi:phenylacetate--CoA ligase family protein [Thermophagus xiamenensis]|nr:phenylacetate-CoA ligase [Thermophagus xiamenensis]
MPVVRYRTRDLTRLHYDTCRCGRTLVRMEKCAGRSDDLLIIRGVNLFPSQIESVLLEMDETTPNYLLVVDRVDNPDTLELHVEVEDRFYNDKIGELQSVGKKIKNQIESAIGLSINIKLVEPKSIARSEGKAKRVVDKRKMK